MDRHANIVAKATRLYLEGRVRPVAGEVFYVEGDHATYLVAVTADAAVCSCPAQGECSHSLAARRAFQDAEDFFADLGDPADDLEARRLGSPGGAGHESVHVNENAPRAAVNGRGV